MERKESHPNACCFDEQSLRLRQNEFSHRVVVQILFDDTEYVQRGFLKYAHKMILRKKYTKINSTLKQIDKYSDKDNDKD